MAGLVSHDTVTTEPARLDGALLGGGVLVEQGRMHAHGALGMGHDLAQVLMSFSISLVD